MSLQRYSPHDAEMECGLYIYEIENSPRDLLVVSGLDGSTVLYLYTLHAEDSDNLLWSNSAIDELETIIDKSASTTLGRYDMEIWDDGIKSTVVASWHYACTYHIDACALAWVLEGLEITSAAQLKDYDGISKHIADVFRPRRVTRRDPFAPKPCFEHDLGTGRIYMSIYEGSLRRTASMTLDEARALRSDLDQIIAAHAMRQED